MTASSTLATSMAATGKPKLTSAAELGGILKQVQQAFGAYQVARNEFVNSLQGFLDKQDEQNVTLEALMKNDVMAVLCCPLAQDCTPGIQAVALQCLGKLSKADPLLSQVVVSCGVLDSLVVSLSHDSPPVQASAAAVLASIATSSAEFASRVLAAGALPQLLHQLQTGSPQVKESAARTLTRLIQSSPAHASLICTDANLSLLVAQLQVQASPQSLLREILLCLSAVAAGGPKLAEALARLQALTPLTHLVRGNNTPPALKSAALNALAQVCRHHDELANTVVNQGVLQSAVALLTDTMTPAVRQNAAALILQVVQKTPDLAELTSKAGVGAAIQKFMVLEAGNVRSTLTGVMIIGTMTTFRAVVARSIVDSGAGQPVIACLGHADNEVVGAAAWAIEQMAQHGDTMAGPLIEQGALQQLIAAHPKAAAQKKNLDLQRKLKMATKATIRNAATSQSLEPFVDVRTPPKILKHLLKKLEVLLARSPLGRQSFVTSGALQRLQQLRARLPEKAAASLAAINSYFPDDVVQYYSS